MPAKNASGDISIDNSDFKKLSEQRGKQIKDKYGEESKQYKKFQEEQKRLTEEAIESEYKLRRRYEEEAHKRKVEKLKEEGKVFQAGLESAFGSFSAIGNTLGSITNTLTSTIDKSLDNYIAQQQKLSAHLAGTNTSLSDITNTLQSTLSTTSIVKQEKVFNNLTKLVSSGINYNVAQRAFLQTLADDLDMMFNASDGTLTQLIRLQNQDLSSNRLAIEYSLQKFLNQNYQTSEYIKQAYSQVSGLLLTSQSTMSGLESMRYEAAIQGQLGSMYSAGMNQSTITNLAKAIDELGSGDLSSIGSGTSNLLLMAAARAGLDYGNILNNGLDSNTANTILSSVTSYLQEMGANQSNVVRSQLGKLFGVSITDIIAANNMSQTGGSISTDLASTLLSDYSGFMTTGTKLQNTIANVLYSFGTNVATNENDLRNYEITRLIAQSGLGQILQSTGSALGSIPGTLMQLAGIAISNAQLIPILTSAFREGGFIDDLKSS